MGRRILVIINVVAIGHASVRRDGKDLDAIDCHDGFGWKWRRRLQWNVATRHIHELFHIADQP